MNNITTHLIDRERELERKRTVALARNLWGDVIDYDARIAECRRLRKWIADEEQKTLNTITNAPTSTIAAS